MTDYYPYRYEPVPPPFPPQAPPPPPAHPHRRGMLIGFGVGVLATAVVLGGVTLATSGNSATVAGSGALGDLIPNTGGSSAPGTGSLPNGGGTNGGGTNGGGTNGGGTNGGGTTGGSTGGSTTANATQQIGIVTIVSTLSYQKAESAGTGMVVSSDGEILTNNHVINGATAIEVTVESTGKQYRADVVGTSPTNDIAVIKLQNASGLATAKLADTSSDVKVGDAVVGVGNAGGTGTLSAASGSVTALNQSITASDESGSSSENLTGLIETNAPIIAGDSGGPLYDSAGKIVGIDTAASASNSQRQSSGASAAYAITIDHAKDIAQQIEAGVQTTTIHIGLPGFLGVGTAAAGGKGAGVQTLLQGGPAAAAGISVGSTVTAVNGKSVTSPDTLRTVLFSHRAGSKVKVTWVDAAGASHTASVTLGTGPAD